MRLEILNYEVDFMTWFAFAIGDFLGIDLHTYFNYETHLELWIGNKIYEKRW
ncbi:MAG: hypothetical protein PVJ67_04095 [Candidatus Pacearchaeota archaeon]|jgi:hypothetical protein